jgi:large subunit ribosomal protein L2
MTKLNIIKVKPVTNGQRHQVNLLQSSLLQNPKVIKNLTEKKNASYGRGSTLGRITSWHKQRGKKRLYRKLRYTNSTTHDIVIGICYDPNRNSLVSLNFDLLNKKFFYSLCSNGLYPGSLTQTIQTRSLLRAGFRTKLKNLPSGTILHNLGDQKGIYAKAAGTQVILINADENNVKVKLPSGKIVDLSSEYYGTVGMVSNSTYYLKCLGKAGRNRNKGRRPIVRGIAMNPVDHPHGGRTNGGRPSVTPWGLPTKCKFKLKRRPKKINK